MNDGFELRLSQHDVLLLEEPVEVLPVVHLLVQLETVVVLVHFDFLGIVAGQDFGIDPPVGEVALRVRDLVGQVERLDPLGHLTGQ